MTDDKLMRELLPRVTADVVEAMNRDLELAKQVGDDIEQIRLILAASIRATAEECKKSCKELEESFSMTSADASMGCGRCAEEISDRFGLEE